MMATLAAERRRVSVWRAGGKRCVDSVLASVGLIVLAPVFGVIALAVRVALGKPIIFRHERPGLHGRLYKMYKFRTMTHDRAADGTLLQPHERLTALGRFLRRTSLDELPQLVNVVKGEMSLVGPRPLFPEYLPHYTPEQSRRHAVRPGITGLAQLQGRNTLAWEERFALDVWYVDHVSPWLDLRILLLTLWKAATQAGIAQPGEGIERPFRDAVDQTRGERSE